MWNVGFLRVYRYTGAGLRASFGGKYHTLATCKMPRNSLVGECGHNVGVLGGGGKQNGAWSGSLQD